MVSANLQIDDLERATQWLIAPPFVPSHDQMAKGGAKEG